MDDDYEELLKKEIRDGNIILEFLEDTEQTDNCYYEEIKSSNKWKENSLDIY